MSDTLQEPDSFVVVVPAPQDPTLPAELEKAIAKVLEGFNEGVFVRDISMDNDPGWAIRALPYIVALGYLSNAVRGPSR